MLIYRFKMLADDNEKFYREIEIKPGNTFEDLHKAILECTNLDEGEMASFYICDSRWNKLKEITLMDVSDSEDAKEENKEKVQIMSKIKLKDGINDPHQKMIYVYDFMNLVTFYLELMKIAEGEDKVKYPRCVRRVGDIQKPTSKLLSVEEIKKILEEAIQEEEEEEPDFGNNDLDFDSGDSIFGDNFDDRYYN